MANKGCGEVFGSAADHALSFRSGNYIASVGQITKYQDIAFFGLAMLKKATFDCWARARQGKGRPRRQGQKAGYRQQAFHNRALN